MNYQFDCIITKLHIITKYFYPLTIQFCIPHRIIYLQDELFPN